MNSCAQSENLVAFLDEELGTQERFGFEAHLADCPACRESLEAQRGLDELLETLPVVEASPGFESRLWARIAREEREAASGWSARLGSLLGWRGLVSGLGVAAVATAALVLALRTPGTGPDPDFLIVADADQFELLENVDIELLDVMEILEAWDGQEI